MSSIQDVKSVLGDEEVRGVISDVGDIIGEFKSVVSTIFGASNQPEYPQPATQPSTPTSQAQPSSFQWSTGTKIMAGAGAALLLILLTSRRR